MRQGPIYNVPAKKFVRLWVVGLHTQLHTAQAAAKSADSIAYCLDIIKIRIIVNRKQLLPMQRICRAVLAGSTDSTDSTDSTCSAGITEP